MLLEERVPRQALIEARLHGAPVTSAAALLAAKPSTLRTGFLLRQVATELKSGSSVLVADFSGTEGELLAGISHPGRAVLAEADERDAVLPLSAPRALPRNARRAAGRVFTSWLLPHSHLRESRDLRQALGLVARLPVLLPRTSLYAWRRYLIDGGFRRRSISALRRRSIDPSPLIAMRPGTLQWRTLAKQVERVLGHDDVLDRLFPLADPSVLVEPRRKPELRVLQARAPGQSESDRYPFLLWLHLLATLTAAPKRRSDGRSYVGRLILIEPPPLAWKAAELLAEAAPRGLKTTIVTSLDEAPTAAQLWFGRAPAIVVDRGLGPERLAAWGYLDERHARSLHDRCRSGRFLFTHQQGSPSNVWCALQPVKRLPSTKPEVLFGARREGRQRYLVTRRKVIQNRRRIESHAQRARRRAAGRGLLERTVRMSCLTASWRRTFRNKGGPGIDGVTVNQFAEAWQERLSELQSQARKGCYRPRPYKRVWLDKPLSGQRAMAIPTVVDRVLMGAAADVVTTILEPCFSDRSFAYRAGRSAKLAVMELTASPRLEEGWALVSDIASYFDNIDHGLLIAMLREKVADEAFIRMVRGWLTNPVRESGVDTRPKRGVPQGAPISPVLSNLCLTPLDRWMEARALDYVRYADDFVALCDSERQARRASAALEVFLGRKLKLSIKPSKSTFVTTTSGFDFLGFAIDNRGARIPETRLAEARRTLRSILGEAQSRTEALQLLDAYVRGFRNYFDLGTRWTTRALAELEAERQAQLEEWAKARKIDLDIVAARAERFATDSPSNPPQGTYVQEKSDEHGPEPPHPPLHKPLPTSLRKVDRRLAAVRARGRGARPAAVNAGGHLGIFGYGALAGLEEERLVLRRKRRTIFEIPFAAIRTVQVDSYGMLFSTPLLEKLAGEDIPVLFTRHGERPWAVLRPLAAKGSADLLRRQLEAQGRSLALEIARELVAAKLTNQERLLRYYAKYKRRRDAPPGQRLRAAAARLAESTASLRETTSQDLAADRRRVFAIEGRAGAFYWSAMKEILGKSFPGRVGQGAADPTNAALNYGYGILYAAVWAAVARAGLDPGIGMLHSSPGARGALVFDLVEPFRVPVVDRPVASLVSKSKRLKLNTDDHLTAAARRQVATAVGRALDRPTPWGGESPTLASHIDRHAKALAIWLQGGDPLRALRIRW